jgi:hypothetical protein
MMIHAATTAGHEPVRLEQGEMFRDADLFWTVRWIRADAIAIFIAAVWAMTLTHGRWWWFFALFLGPDLSISAYRFGSRVGAVVYNTTHMYAWPLALLAAGLANHRSLSTTAALSWIAHIALDQALGYGLKLPMNFEHTALGPIGRSRKDRRTAARSSAHAVD